MENNINFYNQRIDMKNKVFCPYCANCINVIFYNEEPMIKKSFCVTCNKAFKKYTIKTNFKLDFSDEIKLKELL